VRCFLDACFAGRRHSGSRTYCACAAFFRFFVFESPHAVASQDSRKRTYDVVALSDASSRDNVLTTAPPATDTLQPPTKKKHKADIRDYFVAKTPSNAGPGSSRTTPFAPSKTVNANRSTTSCTTAPNQKTATTSSTTATTAATGKRVALSKFPPVIPVEGKGKGGRNKGLNSRERKKNPWCYCGLRMEDNKFRRGTQTMYQVLVSEHLRRQVLRPEALAGQPALRSSEGPRPEEPAALPRRHQGPLLGERPQPLQRHSSTFHSSFSPLGFFSMILALVLLFFPPCTSSQQGQVV